MADLSKNSKNGNIEQNDASDSVKASGLAGSVPNPAGEHSFRDRLKNQELNVIKNGKNGNRLAGILIFAVLVLFIASIVLLFVWFGKNSDSDAHSSNLAYTVLIKAQNVSMIADDAGKCGISKESNVYLSTDEGEINIGEVSDTKVRVNGDGTADVMILITAEARHTVGKGYFVNGEKIAAGKELECRFEGYTDKCTVISVSVSE